jgi:hypothetical protein
LGLLRLGYDEPYNPFREALKGWSASLVRY